MSATPEILRYAAFAAAPEGGNPAGIVLDAGALTDADMQRIAAEVGYPETAFLLGRSAEAGERRYRAARLAGLTSIPCIARSLTEEQQLEAALIENIQREDLNPIEEAQAIKGLMQQCGYTQEEAAKRLGKSRPAVANLLRLLTLPESVIQMVVEGKLSAGHARALAGVSPESRQLELAHQCVLHDYNVRKLEEMAQKQPSPDRAAPAPQRSLSAELNSLQNSVREALGVKTQLVGNERRGKITLTYSSEQELEHIYEVFGRLAN